eukprot:SAG22_NODE_18878_length_280_cov_0.917127_1_plen_84_part_01
MCRHPSDAAANGFSELVEVLLAHGADANAISVDGDLPLYKAAHNGHARATGQLLHPSNVSAGPCCTLWCGATAVMELTATHCFG